MRTPGIRSVFLLRWASGAAGLAVCTACIAASPLPPVPTPAPALPASGTEESRAAESRITELAAHRASGVISLWLDNNIRVHHRLIPLPGPRADASPPSPPLALDSPGHAVITVAFNGAERWETAQSRGISALAALVIDARGRAKFGKAIDATVMQDVLLIRLWGTREQLHERIAWLIQTMQDPAITPEEFEAHHQRAIAALIAPGVGVSAALSDALAASLMADASGEPDARALAPTASQVRALTAQATNEWLRRHEQTAPIEAAIVGDIPFPVASRLVSETLGKLPPRQRPGASPDAAPAAAAAAAAANPLRPVDRATTSARIGAHCIVVSGFAGTEFSRTRDHRLLRACAGLLTQRASTNLEAARLRVHSRVSFKATPAMAFPGSGTVIAAVSTDPADAQAVRATLAQAVDDLAAQGPTLEQLAAVCAELGEQASWFERDARAWSTVLSRATSRGLSPDSLAGAAAFYAALTPQDITDTMARYATAERRIQITICPPPNDVSPDQPLPDQVSPDQPWPAAPREP